MIDCLFVFPIPYILCSTSFYHFVPTRSMGISSTLKLKPQILGSLLSMSSLLVGFTWCCGVVCHDFPFCISLPPKCIPRENKLPSPETASLTACDLCTRVM